MLHRQDQDAISNSLKSLYFERVWRLHVKYEDTNYNQSRPDGACMLYSHYQMLQSILQQNIRDWSKIKVNFHNFWKTIMPEELEQLQQKLDTALEESPAHLESCINYISTAIEKYNLDESYIASENPKGTIFDMGSQDYMGLFFFYNYFCNTPADEVIHPEAASFLFFRDILEEKRQLGEKVGSSKYMELIEKFPNIKTDGSINWHEPTIPCNTLTFLEIRDLITIKNIYILGFNHFYQPEVNRVEFTTAMIDSSFSVVTNNLARLFMEALKIASNMKETEIDYALETAYATLTNNPLPDFRKFYISRSSYYYIIIDSFNIFLAQDKLEAEIKIATGKENFRRLSDIVDVDKLDLENQEHVRRQMKTLIIEID